MGCRGLWNLHVDGKWYRFYRTRGRISPPDDESTLRTIKRLCDKPDNLEGWESVPFPSPIHSNLDYVYTIDLDAGTLTISSWSELDGSLTPSATRMELAKIHEASSKNHQMVGKPQHMFSENVCESNKAQAKKFATFEMDFGIPTPMNELQGRFFTDLVFIWRFYIDDPSTWRYKSPVFRVLCSAFLRLAAWDFEVSSDCNVELPISFASIPLWSYPDGDVYWFHEYLIVLQDEVVYKAMINGAVSKAKSYIGDSLLRHHDVRLIIISPRHVAFVELSHEVVLASKSLTFLSNYSATHCSSGFRALARVLTSNCWKKPRAHREKWPVNMPLEIFQMILHELEPRDAVAFSQASFAAEQCYYASESQFKNIDVRSFKSSIPCCGKRTGLETHDSAVGKLEKDVRSELEVLLNRFNCDSPNLPIYDQSDNS
ncbi:hypothetical protein PITC_024490 [Penicillium italicum]|uniref:Uncharacterized protein n=1 Tax=Penicillium italicum TaxID=40296 RepID=A0A0A2LD07_PENIT|nr:hypothetical protein PITC_024490 [Penicillium italicum]